MRTNRLTIGVMLVLFAGCSKSPVSPTVVRPEVPASERLRATIFPAAGVLRSGSTVTVTAYVRTATGDNAAGALVQFATSTGSIVPPVATVNSAGQATATLTAGDPGTVTVTFDGLTTTVPVNATVPYRISVSGPTAITIPGQPASTNPLAVWDGLVTLVKTSGAPVDPQLPMDLRVFCGDGSIGAGVVDGRETTVKVFFGPQAVRCTFRSSGITYPVRAVARAANGWTVESSVLAVRVQ